MPRHDRAGHWASVAAGGSYQGLVTFDWPANLWEWGSGDEGGSQPHNIMQPFTVLNYIIKE